MPKKVYRSLFDADDVYEVEELTDNPDISESGVAKVKKDEGGPTLEGCWDAIKKLSEKFDVAFGTPKIKDGNEPATWMEVEPLKQEIDGSKPVNAQDARDAYAVFLGGGTPYVCFANSEASARKFAEESEGDGSRATKVIKLVKNTRDYDYYVGDPRSVPIADADGANDKETSKDVKDAYSGFTRVGEKKVMDTATATQVAFQSRYDKVANKG